MKARQNRSVFLLGAAALVMGAVGIAKSGDAAAAAPPMVSGAALAQECRQDSQKQNVLVPVLVSSQAADGVIVADTIRYLIARYMCRSNPGYFPIRKDNMELTLQTSGFPTDTALHPGDIKALASVTSADIVVWGEVARPSRNDWRYRAMIMSPRDHKLVQPLPEMSGNNVARLLGSFRGAVDLPFKAMPHVKRCDGTLRFEVSAAMRANDAAKIAEGLQSAEAAAKEALAVFPASTLARICLLNVYNEKKDVAPDSILKITADILEANPEDWYALVYSEKAERARGNVERANNILLHLLVLEPTNVDVQEEVIVQLATSGKYDSALVVLDRAKLASPGQPAIVSLEGTIGMAIEDYPRAVTAFEELGKIAPNDTMLVNPSYFRRYATALRNLDRRQEAVAVLNRALEKFPANADVLQLQSQLMREIGDLEGAAAMARRVIEINPSISTAYLQLGQVYLEMRDADSLLAQADSLISTVHRSLPHAQVPNDSVNAANLLIGEANRMLAKVQGIDTSNLELVVRSANLGIKLGRAASEILPEEIGFHWTTGALAFIALSKFITPRVLSIPATARCEDAKQVAEWFNLVKEELEDKRGGRQQPEAAGQMLGSYYRSVGDVNEIVRLRC